MVDLAVGKQHCGSAAGSKRSLPEDVRSMEGLGLGAMADSLDVVPIRANDECAIVVWVVVRA